MDHDYAAASDDDVRAALATERQRVRELEAALAEAEAKRVNLETALVTARSIGAAVGILMALHKLDEPTAFDVLREASQRRNRKLRDVADEVRMTGTTPE